MQKSTINLNISSNYHKLNGILHTSSYLKLLTHFHEFVDVVCKININVFRLVELNTKEPGGVWSLCILWVAAGEGSRVNVHRLDGRVVLQARDQVSDL